MQPLPVRNSLRPCGDAWQMSRWRQPPGFDACNSNTYLMSNQETGQVDLCGLDDYFRDYGGGSTGQAAGDLVIDAKLSVRTNITLSNISATGFIGVYGGYACASYTITAELIPRTANESCSKATNGSCPEGRTPTPHRPNQPQRSA